MQAAVRVLGQFKGFFCYTRKNFPGSNATLLPKFLCLWIQELVSKVQNSDTDTSGEKKILKPANVQSAS